MNQYQYVGLFDKLQLFPAIGFYSTGMYFYQRSGYRTHEVLWIGFRISHLSLKQDKQNPDIIIFQNPFSQIGGVSMRKLPAGKTYASISI